MARLANKVAIVTGLSRGIGRAIVEGFAGEGASVVASYNMAVRFKQSHAAASAAVRAEPVLRISIDSQGVRS
jgi:3-oxoacyl-[acyl-carrier protein] reductase